MPEQHQSEHCQSDSSRRHVTRVIAYALPTMPVAFLVAPVTMAIIQGMYAEYFGVSLASIASILLISRLFDAITDPLVGYFSDRYQARHGSRLPVIITGMVLFTIAACFVYMPNGINPVAPYDTVSPAYLLFGLLAFYLAWTMFEIPHLAWGSELATDAKSKNMIFSMRTLGYSAGGLIFYAVPLLPFFDSHAFSPQTLAWSMLLAVVFIPIACIGMNAAGKSDQKISTVRDLTGEMVSTTRAIHNLITQLKIVSRVLIQNKPFLLVVAAFFFAGGGAGMSLALVYIFASSFLGIGEHLPFIYMLSMIVAMLSIGLWYGLSLWLSKKVCWGLGVLMIIAGVLGFSQLTPGNNQWIAFLALLSLITVGAVSLNVFIPSLLSDAVDYGRWKFGKNYAATYFATYTVITKTNVAIGGALGLGLAGYFGFDVTADSHSVEQIFGLHLAIAYIPAFIIALSLIFVALTPLNARRNAIIQRRLDKRKVA